MALDVRMMNLSQQHFGHSHTHVVDGCVANTRNSRASKKGERDQEDSMIALVVLGEICMIASNIIHRGNTTSSAIEFNPYAIYKEYQEVVPKISAEQVQKKCCSQSPTILLQYRLQLLSLLCLQTPMYM